MNTPSTKKTLIFTNFEYNFINLINFYLTHHNTENPNDIIVCRIAGGWVRDKILNIPSNDIDIAIENKNVSGKLFLNNLVNFYKDNDNIHIKSFNEIHNTKFKFKNIFNTNIHATKVNPEKSKHLETAMATIFNHDIDFVSLRKEVYTNENNRIPTIEVGTPLEDCLRRDCTINSIFYNINTGYLEDLSNKGLVDLQNGIIRTPLEPMKTFTDDPLRIFRLLRFKNKLNFQYSEDLMSCFKNNHDVLVDFVYKKVSRERVAIEANKILNTNSISICKNFLKDLEYFGFERFLYSNNKNSYEDELEKLSNEKNSKKVNQKKVMLFDKITLHERTLNFFEIDLKTHIKFFIEAIESHKDLASYKLDMTTVVHAILLFSLLDPRLQYSNKNKQTDLSIIKKDIELALLSNGIAKTKVRQIIALQELLDLVNKKDFEFIVGDVDNNIEIKNRAELCFFVKEQITDFQIYNSFKNILHIFYPQHYTKFIKGLKENKIINDDNDDLDAIWNKDNLKLKWNGSMIMKHLNKKPGVWMSEVIRLQWLYYFEKELDLVNDEDTNIEDFINWVNTQSNILKDN